MGFQQITIEQGKLMQESAKIGDSIYDPLPPLNNLTYVSIT